MMERKAAEMREIIAKSMKERKERDRRERGTATGVEKREASFLPLVLVVTSLWIGTLLREL